LQKYDVLGFSKIFRIILLKKTCGIDLQPHGPGPWASAHECTGLIKRRPLATSSTTRINPSEPLFHDLISTTDLRVDGYDGFMLDSSTPAKSGAGRCHGQ
jgi:hypothetical protein